MPEGPSIVIPSIVILREDAAKFAGRVIDDVSGNSRLDLQRMRGQRGGWRSAAGASTS